MSVTAAYTTGTTSVDQLLRYAAHRFASAGVAFRPPRMSRFIRQFPDTATAKDAIDTYLADRLESASWAGFELYANGYADPTGAHAARNVDLERRAVSAR